MADATLHEFPGQTVSLAFEAPEDVTDELELVRLGLEAIDAFILWVEPLSAELSIGLLDVAANYPVEDPLPKRPQWMLCRDHLPPGVRVEAMLADPIVETRGALTTEALYAWIAAALAQDAPDGFRTTWRELRIDAVRVALPAELAGRDELLLAAGVGTHRIPVERDAGGAWIAGPIEQLPTEPPVALRITNTNGYFELQVARHMSVWTSGPGARDVDESIASLTQRGWSKA
jgi:hypothetical protein